MCYILYHDDMVIVMSAWDELADFQFKAIS